jgi:type IV secretion system protein VirB11
MTTSVSQLHSSGVYLRSYLEPFSQWLERGDVTEILVNRPGEVWIESTCAASMQRQDAHHISNELLERLARQIARSTAQGISREHPLLAAALPCGARIQMVAPPASGENWVLAIRRHTATDLELEAFNSGPIAAKAPNGTIEDENIFARRAPIEFLRGAVRDRRTILISGGTSSGKTTFLNTLLKLVPSHERIIIVEDTPEIDARQPNRVNLIAVKGDLAEARVGVDDLLQASLRLRPDRLIVGEIRGKEGVSFLRAVNTGHPGSFTTVHASSTSGALEQISLMVSQAGWAQPRNETIAYARSVIDVIVQLSRSGGRRCISDIEVITR